MRSNYRHIENPWISGPRFATFKKRIHQPKRLCIRFKLSSLPIWKIKVEATYRLKNFSIGSSYKCERDEFLKRGASMESLPKVIALIEAEVSNLQTMLDATNPETSAKVASEQAGLGKLLAFANEIVTIQAKFEAKSRSASSKQRES